jgi:hypothetical protein
MIPRRACAHTSRAVLHTCRPSKVRGLENCQRKPLQGYQGLTSHMLDRLPLALVELCMAHLEVHIMLRCARVCRLTKQALSGN